MELNRGANQSDKDLTSSKTEKKLYKFLLDKGLLTEYIEWEEKSKQGIPLCIFNSDLGAYEAICKYFKEKGLKNKEIADLTSRDSKSVWQAINKASKKHSQKFQISKSPYILPYDILQNTNLSVFETIVFHLKQNYDLGFTEIGELLSRDPRTIWTIYRRAIKK